MRKNSDVKFSFPTRLTDSEEILPGRGEIRRTRAVTLMTRSLVFLALVDIRCNLGYDSRARMRFDIFRKSFFFYMYFLFFLIS